MSIRRSKFEIYMDILAAIKGGTVIPTRIMYRVNLSWKPLKQILETLQAQILIEEQPKGDIDKRTRKVYALTEKGENVLNYFDRAKVLMDIKRAVENFSRM
ncbi:winged helix-turn-helix domain-containing protein [Candidatus Bathyarchaeota archaeon]|nr:winged helix-turn-helix domain-containing protein [Candidatus Bathyarchaeota archaeon]